jgi:hypothetical protein
VAIINHPKAQERGKEKIGKMKERERKEKNKLINKREKKDETDDASLWVN